MLLPGQNFIAITKIWFKSVHMKGFSFPWWWIVCFLIWILFWGSSDSSLHSDLVQSQIVGEQKTDLLAEAPCNRQQQDTIILLWTQTHSMGSLPIPTLYRNDWNTITRKWWFFGRVGSRKNIHDGLLQTGINVRVHHKIPNIPQHEFHTLSITDDWWKYNALPHTGHAGKRIERRCDFWSRAYHYRIQPKSLVQGTRRKIFVRGRI